MSISRRGFLRSLGIGAATAVVAPSVITEAMTGPSGIAKAVGEGRVALRSPAATGAIPRVLIDPAAKTVTPTGSMTVGAMYRSIKEQWLDDAQTVQHLIVHSFPATAVTPEYIEMVDGWRLGSPENICGGAITVRDKGWDGDIVERWTTVFDIGDPDTPILLKDTDHFPNQVILS